MPNTKIVKFVLILQRRNNLFLQTLILLLLQEAHWSRIKLDSHRRSVVGRILDLIKLYRV